MRCSLVDPTALFRPRLLADIFVFLLRALWYSIRMSTCFGVTHCRGHDLREQ